ncbi:MAG: hypothetical protein EZS28_013984 [Streblomastix strix]|uniref:Uncharacterized protein n=1 Tax=Streblomastix strix TaxID=222440 RepID=A0A5J4W6B4_9EUKA|nr:MAG: hypothetical protein EZS28_013984 [Streblomastix strix]
MLDDYEQGETKVSKLDGNHSRAWEVIPDIQSFSGAKLQPQILIDLLSSCCSQVNWHDTASEEEFKSRKRKGQYLVQIIEYIRQNQRTQVTLNMNSDSQSIFPTETWIYIRRLIDSNIFRSISAPDRITTHASYIGLEDPVQYIDWNHLDLIYSILLSFIVAPEVNPRISSRKMKFKADSNQLTTNQFLDQKNAQIEKEQDIGDGWILQGIIDTEFVENIILMMDSEDQREREAIKVIVHRQSIQDIQIIECQQDPQFRIYSLRIYTTPFALMALLNYQKSQPQYLQDLPIHINQII